MKLVNIVHPITRRTTTAVMVRGNNVLMWETPDGMRWTEDEIRAAQDHGGCFVVAMALGVIYRLLELILTGS